MAAPRARVIDGQKFMWDGRDYASAEEADRAAEEYRRGRFEIRTVEEGGRFQVYTRRVASEGSEV